MNYELKKVPVPERGYRGGSPTAVQA